MNISARSHSENNLSATEQLGFERSHYFSYYHDFRTHLSLNMDCPTPRPIQPRELGRVRRMPEVGGLHHHYEGIAA